MRYVCSTFFGASLYSVCFTSGKWNVKEVCQFQGIPLSGA